jgi:hypothetical protein
LQHQQTSYSLVFYLKGSEITQNKHPHKRGVNKHQPAKSPLSLHALIAAESGSLKQKERLQSYCSCEPTIVVLLCKSVSAARKWAQVGQSALGIAFSSHALSFFSSVGRWLAGALLMMTGD